MKAALTTTIVFILLTYGLVALRQSKAETDLAKNLVGKWQGEVLLPGAGGRDGPYRTLVIKSVREQDGAWAVEALYGVTGKSLRQVEVAMEVISGEAIISFRTPANSPVKLTLIKEKHLVGSFRLAGAGRREYSMKLEKVE